MLHVTKLMPLTVFRSNNDRTMYSFFFCLREANGKEPCAALVSPYVLYLPIRYSQFDLSQMLYGVGWYHVMMELFFSSQTHSPWLPLRTADWTANEISWPNCWRSNNVLFSIVTNSFIFCCSWNADNRSRAREREKESYIESREQTKRSVAHQQ